MNRFLPSRPSPFYRITSILFVFALLFSLCTGCQSRRVIVNGLDEKEANEIIVFLANRGIDAYKVRAEVVGAGGGDQIPRFNISVSNEEATRAMALLNQSGLPRRRGESLLDIFRNVGLVPSEMQDKIRFQQGLAEQIASTIRKIDGILDADVQLSFPEEDPLNPGTVRGNISASVYVKHGGVLDDPNAHLVTRIKRLVSGSINGLEYDNVTVIGDRARYSELGLDVLPSGRNEGEKEFVRLWSVTLAKESITQFRLLFFSFIVIILLLLILGGWLLWKILPFLRSPGGWKQLFTPHPLSTSEQKFRQKEETKQVGSKEKEKAPPPESDESEQKPSSEEENESEED